MSAMVPSISVAFGSPASIAGLTHCRLKSPSEGLTKTGSTPPLPSVRYALSDTVEYDTETDPPLDDAISVLAPVHKIEFVNVRSELFN